MSLLRSSGSEEDDKSKDWRPEAANGSPKGVKIKRKKRSTRKKKKVVIMSRSFHCFCWW